MRVGLKSYIMDINDNLQLDFAYNIGLVYVWYKLTLDNKEVGPRFSHSLYIPYLSITLDSDN